MMPAKFINNINLTFSFSFKLFFLSINFFIFNFIFFSGLGKSDGINSTSLKPICIGTYKRYHICNTQVMIYNNFYHVILNIVIPMRKIIFPPYIGMLEFIRGSQSRAVFKI